MALSNDIIAFNIKAHDKIASRYDDLHVEIFNPTEQQRINHVLQEAHTCLNTPSGKKVILDYGSGTGNLTCHLLDLGALVIAADVSQECLDVVRTKFSDHQGLSTIVLNGSDLKELESNSIDMVTCYSVLHHVPDYLEIISEFVRVVRPGGVIYIDHEVDETYWQYDATYLEYLKELGESFYDCHVQELGVEKISGLIENIKTQWNWLTRFLAGPKPIALSGAGDIHVYCLDHIEWSKVEEILSRNCTIQKQSTYLVCREIDKSAPVWERWRSRCFDMRYLIARKKAANVL